MSHSADAEVRTLTGTSEIGGITVRLHTYTLLGCASSGDSYVHTGESNVFNLDTLRPSIGFSRRAVH